jgi:regulator of protease activity HflC (stomatin/prohibitin superfamily)
VGLFVFAVLAAVAGVVASIFGVRAALRRKARLSPAPLLVGAGIVSIAVIAIAVQSFNQVPARNVAVETVYGRPVAVLDNGGHWTAPWAKVQTFDATVQTVTDTPTVRLKNNTTAQVDASVQWQIDPNADFLSLYNSYRTFDNIKQNVIVRQLSAALNAQFSTFDPLSAIDQNTGTSTVNVQSFAAPVEAALKQAMPAGLTIQNVTIVNVKYSAELENQINAIITAAAQTRVAQQQELTNKAQAAANKALTQGGGAPTQTVIEQNCLNLLNTAIQKGYQLPAGFSCIGGVSTLALSTK